MLVSVPKLEPPWQLAQALPASGDPVASKLLLTPELKEDVMARAAMKKSEKSSVLRIELWLIGSTR